MAENGDAKTENKLGNMCALGQGVAQDYSEAAKWYRKAADQGEPRAQVALGSLYVMGRVVSQNYAEAMKWHRKAADQGEPKRKLPWACTPTAKAFHKIMRRQ